MKALFEIWQKFYLQNFYLLSIVAYLAFLMTKIVCQSLQIYFKSFFCVIFHKYGVKIWLNVWYKYCLSVTYYILKRFQRGINCEDFITSHILTAWKYLFHTFFLRDFLDGYVIWLKIMMSSYFYFNFYSFNVKVNKEEICLNYNFLQTVVLILNF